MKVPASLAPVRSPATARTAAPSDQREFWGGVELLLMASIAGMLLVLALPVLPVLPVMPVPPIAHPEQATDRAASYLQTLSSVLDRGYPQSRSYPVLTHMPLPDLSETRRPAGDEVFRYELNSTSQSYTLSAFGQKGLRCVLTVNHLHVRTATGTDCGQVRW